MIYRLCLVGQGPSVVHLRYGRQQPSLLVANKQIFLEASSMFYSGKTFHFSSELFEDNSILSWLRNTYGLIAANTGVLSSTILDVPFSSKNVAGCLDEKVCKNIFSLLQFALEHNTHSLKIQIYPIYPSRSGSSDGVTKTFVEKDITGLSCMFEVMDTFMNALSSHLRYGKNFGEKFREPILDWAEEIVRYLT